MVFLLGVLLFEEPLSEEQHAETAITKRIIVKIQPTIAFTPFYEDNSSIQSVIFIWK